MLTLPPHTTPVGPGAREKGKQQEKKLATRHFAGGGGGWGSLLVLKCSGANGIRVFTVYLCFSIVVDQRGCEMDLKTINMQKLKLRKNKIT